jgi:ATP-binding cassette subfamily C protein LapB
MTEPSFAGSGPSTPQDPLAPLLARLASLQGHAVPWHRFAMMSEGRDGTPLAGLTAATRARELWQARFPAGEVRTVEWPATAADVPALWIGPEGHSAGEQHYVVQGVLSSGALSCLDGSGQTIELPAAQARAGQLLQLLADATARVGQAGLEPARSATDWFKHAIARRRSVFVDGMVATLTVNAIGLTTSFYSMQVYDRVLPTMGYATLWVLTLGMGLAILLELLMRHLRARQIERGCKAIDEELSSVFFGQALAIRMDQRPATVGTFAAQIRQFEMVRNFLTSSTMFVLADAPFALLFVGVLALIAGPLALVPLALIPLSLLTGLAFSRSLARRSEEHVADSNRKNGLLIEAIDGIESVKAAGAEWKLLQRWRALTRTLADNETAIKDLTNLSSNLTQTLQQLGYVGLIVAGTYAIGAGQLTMGGMIACTIISGRALGPIAQIAGLVVQWQQARVALKGLDQIMALPADSQPQERRLVPDHCEGRLRLEQLRHGYGEDVPALEIERLSFGPGERVAVLGAVGSGKSTLIKVLSGLYRPAAGRAFLDDVDMAQLAPDFMREQIGYLPQDVRLFQGSLRDNLALGLPSPTDAQILAAARQTGLDRLIAAHPRGLGLQISEGGRGLSGGQRQLAGLTRLVLARPRVLLLDEPTAAMDPRLEEFVAERVFAQSPADATLVVVTHKPALLRHFNRIVVLERGRVLADGPRDEVLRRLQAAAAQAAVPAHPPRPLTSNPATT